jgi:hypothetical protein
VVQSKLDRPPMGEARRCRPGIFLVQGKSGTAVGREGLTQRDT